MSGKGVFGLWMRFPTGSLSYLVRYRGPRPID